MKISREIIILNLNTLKIIFFRITLSLFHDFLEQIFIKNK